MGFPRLSRLPTCPADLLQPQPQAPTIAFRIHSMETSTGPRPRPSPAPAPDPAPAPAPRAQPQPWLHDGLRSELGFAKWRCLDPTLTIFDTRVRIQTCPEAVQTWPDLGRHGQTCPVAVHESRTCPVAIQEDKSFLKKKKTCSSFFLSNYQFLSFA